MEYLLQSRKARREDSLETDSREELLMEAELLVNPALVLLARQRGELDCGGFEYLVIRYGHFFQVVVPLADGHVSVAVEPDSDPLGIADTVLSLVGSTA